ncbi:hypothetical protein PAXRUDRAFT_147506 [Paxillus rubicundulus Ve08.2h10]|uniref:Uncharacterized protein n=1 Tax=Paxillus rubicundulus Ve08.2h10 TaxID=930991 RepID=A0A0D0DU42_9AGAM|nr:hypothetical protein PAXRUDRAFT_147506 [Paxillus rubicundulus Ve08.2h10]
MHTENLLTIHTSTDHPNIRLCAWKIKYTLSLYADLGFLIPLDWKHSDPLPPKFLIFFDNIQDTIGVARYLQSQLPLELCDKIRWFNSDMTTKFKEAAVTDLISGDVIGLCTTEAFGMASGRHS